MLRELSETKRTTAKLFFTFLVSYFFFYAVPTASWAAPTTATEAQLVAQNWLKSVGYTPLDTSMGVVIKKVSTYSNSDGEALYYIVNLQPDGFIVVSADDLIEPIIAFQTSGTYGSDTDNPMYSIVSLDMATRIDMSHSLTATGSALTAPGSMQASAALTAQKKWRTYLNASTTNDADSSSGIATISDVRVSPLVETNWGQSTVNGSNVFNYYTPSNYVSGCVATAMAQVIRYYQYPTTGVGTGSYTVSVDGTPQSLSLRGGDGSGSAYNWSSMTLDIADISSDTQRQAIGALTYDAGVSVNMAYTSAGSGANTNLAASALKNTFSYGNAIYSYNSGNDIPAATFTVMINSNLHASLPVILGITGSGGGHAVVCDGYGYDSSTLYHHLNLGWNGSDNVWYNLPDIQTSYYTYTSVYRVIYNIFTSGSGEIISGRVVDGDENALSGVTVTANDGTSTYTDTTDTKGNYAIFPVPSNTSFTLSFAKGSVEYPNASRTTTTTASTNNSTSCGNIFLFDTNLTPSSVPAGTEVQYGFLAIVMLGMGLLLLHRKRC